LAVLVVASVLVLDPTPAPAATTQLTPVAAPWSTPRLRAFYSRSVTSELFSSAAVGDVDGDAQPDVVAAYPDGFVYAWHTNGVRFLSYDTGPGAVQASPALVDLNGDGVLDILAGNTAGYVKGFTGSGATLFAVRDSCSPICGIFGTPTTADLDHDGGLDVIASSWDHYLYAWHLNGTQVSGFPKYTKDTIWSSPAVADLDGDGWTEIVVGGDCDGVPGQDCYPQRGGWVFVYRHDGALMPGWPKFIPDQVVWSSPALADLSGDGLLAIVVGTGTMSMPGGQKVYSFDRNGNALPGWPVSVGGKVMSSPAIGDLDGDGALDVVTVAEDGRIYAHSRTGALLPGWPQCAANDRNACPVTLHGSAVIGDVDNDGAQEVVFGGEQWMRVFSGTGVVEKQVPTVSGTAPLTAAPTLALVNNTTWIVQTAGFDDTGDGLPDVGTLWAWSTGTAPGVLAWPTFKQNMRRAGTIVDTTAPVTLGFSPLAATQSTTAFPISWSATDRGSGVARFDVDVMDGTGSWVRWLTNAPVTSRSGPDASGGRTFYGLAGHTYTFRVRTFDAAGNVSAWTPSGSTTVNSSATRSAPFAAAYAVAGTGALSAIDSPPVAAPSWPGQDVARGLAVLPTGGGYVLDWWGALHPFGTAPPIAVSGYWVGQDVTRGLALNPDGKSGYVLDFWGGLHPVGNAARVTNGPYWQGWDIARGVVLLPTSTAANPAGYVLDGWGGLHPFGSAPQPAITGYWSGRDIARGIVLNGDGTSGYVLEGFGGLHPFGGAVAVTNGPYWSGRDIASAAVSIGTRTAPAGYVLDGFGGVHRYGSAPAVQASLYWGYDIARGLAVAQ
jgi:hypothetical protein